MSPLCDGIDVRGQWRRPEAQGKVSHRPRVTHIILIEGATSRGGDQLRGSTQHGQLPRQALKREYGRYLQARRAGEDCAEAAKAARLVSW